MIVKKDCNICKILYNHPVRIEKELTKLYYSIGEVAELFDVSPSLLRYWESEFKILSPQKNRKGDRKYLVKDIQKIEQIYTLVKERGFTLDGAKKEIKKPTSSATSSTDVIQKLKAINEKLKSLRDKLEE